MQYIFSVKLLCKNPSIQGKWAEQIYRIIAPNSGEALRAACELAGHYGLEPDSGRAAVDVVRRASPAEMAAR